MSPITSEQKPSGPDGKPSETASKGIRIPVWWSLVALCMAALVYLPILYANTHSQKPAAQEEPQAAQKVESQPETKVAASSEMQQPAVAAKQAEPAEPAAAVTPPKEEPAQAEPAKPAAAAEVTPPKQEPAKVEPAKPVTAAEIAPPKQEPAKVEPAKPAAAEAAMEPKEEPAKAEPEKAAAPAEVTQKQASSAPVEQKQDEEKPAATVTAQAQKEAAQVAKPQEGSQANQKVALTKPAEKLKVGDDTIFYRIEGADKEGRAAAFDFITLTNDYKWALGSASRIVSGGKLIPESQTANRILAPKVRDSLANVTDVIGVGLASQDGKRADEEARALARSKTAAAWIKQAAKPGVGLWTLSLGQYDSKDCKKKEDSDTNFDRPVLFVSVRSKAEGVNLQEALANAISGHNNLPSRDCYSRFDLSKVQ